MPFKSNFRRNTQMNSRSRRLKNIRSTISPANRSPIYYESTQFEPKPYNNIGVNNVGGSINPGNYEYVPSGTRTSFFEHNAEKERAMMEGFDVSDTITLFSKSIRINLGSILVISLIMIALLIIIWMLQSKLKSISRVLKYMTLKRLESSSQPVTETTGYITQLIDIL